MGKVTKLRLSCYLVKPGKKTATVSWLDPDYFGNNCVLMTHLGCQTGTWTLQSSRKPARDGCWCRQPRYLHQYPDRSHGESWTDPCQDPADQTCIWKAPRKIHDTSDGFEAINRQWIMQRLFLLTHSGRAKIPTISQTTFSGMKMYEFPLRFHWSFFLRFKSSIFQHWYR